MSPILGRSSTEILAEYLSSILSGSSAENAAVTELNKRKEKEIMSKVFRDYAEVDVKSLEGYTVVKASAGINAEETGMMLELEKQIDNVTLGIDIVCDPDYEAEEAPIMISNEYVKRIDKE